jgi:hypothetical protein
VPIAKQAMPIVIRIAQGSAISPIENRRQAGERLARQHLHAGKRGHPQPHQGAVRALGDQADAEGHRAADQPPDHALRKGDVERIARAVINAGDVLP